MARNSKQTSRSAAKAASKGCCCKVGRRAAKTQFLIP